MAQCTAPRKGHRTASGAASCPVHGGRSRYTGFGGGYYSSAQQPAAASGSAGHSSRPKTSSRPRWSPATSPVTYTDAQSNALAPIRREIERRADELDLHDLFLCHAWDDRRGAASELHDLLEQQGLSVWFSERKIVLGTSWLREIDKGLAKSRVGLVLVTPAFLKRVEAGGVSDKELSELLHRDQLIPIMHRTTFPELRRVSPLLASRNGLSTEEDSMEVIAVKIAELVSLDDE